MKKGLTKTWKENLQETKRHYVDWWNHRGIVLNMWEHFQEGVTPHADIQAPPPPKDLNQKWFDSVWRAQFLNWYVAHSCLKADMLPVANTQLGPGSLAAILGSGLEGGEDTIWIHPDPNFKDDGICFDRNHPNWLLHKQLLTECKRLAQGNYYVGMPDLMEGLDVLASLKGTDQVLLDTVMQPEVVERQVQRINDIYFQVFDELYDIIREGDEMAFCYFSAWAPGRMTKLQCDISTMISEEDYRRFVQPYIRQQCQQIDYTLYHLDGVGAIRHLPALLEIEELNAIQWTPGVGEPQGGNPKWYDLYRSILDGGKSVLACWVTLDELRPLLDNIGGEGVHIEMDFHNETEVEQAMEIVAQYQTAPSMPLPFGKNKMVQQAESRNSLMTQQAEQRILVLDGGMGTMLQQYGLQENDFRGKRFAAHSCSLAGCNDVLSLTQPQVVKKVHRRYMEAGADIIETNTFNAQRVSMADFGLQENIREINLEACRIAREVADEFSRKNPNKPRFVVGSIGPTNKTCSFSTDGEPTLDNEMLRKAYQEQIEALVDGGVDALLIETIFDTMNAEMAIEAAENVFAEKKTQVPLMLSFNVATPEGMNMFGQNIPDFIEKVTTEHLQVDFFSVGINCTPDIVRMTPFIYLLAERFSLRISCYPNAGKPDGKGGYDKSPEQLQADLWPLVEHHVLNVVGGCCGTTDKHIAKMAQLVEPVSGLFVSPKTGERLKEKFVSLKADESIKELTSAFSHSSPSSSSPSQRLFNAILAGKGDDAEAATRAAIAEGCTPHELINDQMIRAMGEIGQRFQDGKAFVPQLLMAGRAMKGALELLKPMMAGGEMATLGKVVIGTVKGDLHDIGKNLVASMLEGCGFEVINVGIDVSVEKFIDAIRQYQPDILCMSALLTTTMGQMREVVETLKKEGLRDSVKVMVGGAPVSQAFADEIGADGYSDNANSAVAVAKQLLAIDN
jgi:corrinoid protein of di/trimethylamine methyltransferase